MTGFAPRSAADPVLSAAAAGKRNCGKIATNSKMLLLRRFGASGRTRAKFRDDGRRLEDDQERGDDDNAVDRDEQPVLVPPELHQLDNCGP